MYDLNRSCRITGIDRNRLQLAAETLSGKRICFVVGGGVLQQAAPAPILDALINLALLTGSADKKGGWLYLPTYENNQAGAWDMGAAPNTLPGGESLRVDDSRRAWERIWQTKISPDDGLDAARMIEEAEKGNLKALYIMGENPLRSFPQPDRVRRALQNLEFLVVQDIISTETADLADTVLPGAPFSEKEGAFTNMEGRIQTFRQAVPCRGNAKPDWEILALLARKISRSLSYPHLESIRDEIRRLIPAYRQLSTDGSEGWIASRSGVDRPAYLPMKPPAEPESDPAYPYTAILCSSRFHLGSGTRTAESERIRGIQSPGAIELSIPDAQRLGVSDGGSVRISSPWGTLERQISLSKDLKPGLILVPKAFAGNAAMKLVGLPRARRQAFSGWRTVPVKVEPLTS
jgi:formate dehydrogenase alpha subunit